jgi:fucose 4-O-acetylase-like acetyltransferase
MRSMERVLWVDQLRGIGIIFVVAGHVWRGLYGAGMVVDDGLFTAVDSAIYLFHMPLFFMLSGFFFADAVRHRGFLSSLRSRAIGLLYPLLFWSYVIGGLKFAVSDAANSPLNSIQEVLIFPFPPKDIYWFLWALFLIQTYFSIFVIWFPKRSAITAGAAACAAAYLLVPLGSWSQWLSPALNFAVFFAIGILLPKSAPTQLRDLGLGVSLFIVAQLVILFFPQPVTLAYFAIQILGTLGAFYALGWVAAKGPSDLLISLGSISLAVYAMHTIATSSTRGVLARIGVENLALHTALGTVAGIALPALAFAAMNRLGVKALFGFRAVSPYERRSLA